MLKVYFSLFAEYPLCKCWASHSFSNIIPFLIFMLTYILNKTSQLQWEGSSDARTLPSFNTSSAKKERRNQHVHPCTRTHTHTRLTRAVVTCVSVVSWANEPVRAEIPSRANRCRQRVSFAPTCYQVGAKKRGMETERERERERGRERGRQSAPSREGDISAGPMKCSTCHNLKSTDSQGHLCKVTSPNKTLCDISRWHAGTPASHLRVTAQEVPYADSLICRVLTKSQKCYHSSHLDHVSQPQSQL